MYAKLHNVHTFELNAHAFFTQIHETLLYFKYRPQFKKIQEIILTDPYDLGTSLNFKMNTQMNRSLIKQTIIITPG